jgi:membrane fusion protein, adhesin transport system
MPKRPGRLARTPRRYTEFLPDAEGLASGRHSPLAGLLIIAVALVFGAMLGFSAWAEVEQVVRATGQVVPESRVKQINHGHGGRIAAIHVREGQRVAQGEVLLVLDPELREAEVAELRGRFQVKAMEVARLEAEAGDGELSVPEDLAEARPDLVQAQIGLMRAREESHASRTRQLTSSVERREREVRTLAAEIGRLQNSLSLIRQQEEAVRELAERGLYPRLRVVQVERQVSDVRGELAKAEESLEAARAALEEARSQLEGLERDRRSRLLGDLAQAKADRDRLAEALRHQEALLRGLVVQAPVDGIVQDIAVTSVGQSVGANDTLMRLVPVGEGLVVEARVANEDIAYLHIGQPATIKVRAFDFLRYGALAGRIEHIAPDATPDPRTGERAYSVLLAAEPGGHGGLDPEAVVPGMVVDVELHIGERTILSYLTDRILQLREDVFREG